MFGVNRFRPFDLLALIAMLPLMSCSQPAQLPRLSPEAVILAFGDSLTYGTGVAPDQSYPTLLSTMTGYRVINAGIPGEVSMAGLARLPGLLDETQPELIIICHAANDILRGMSLERAGENLQAMIQLAQQRGIAVVILAVPKFSIMLSPAGFYETIAKDMNVPIEADILSTVLADHKLKSDQIHPNSKGYRLMAEAVFALLEKAGAL